MKLTNDIKHIIVRTIGISIIFLGIWAMGKYSISSYYFLIGLIIIGFAYERFVMVNFKSDNLENKSLLAKFGLAVGMMVIAFFLMAPISIVFNKMFGSYMYQYISDKKPWEQFQNQEQSNTKYSDKIEDLMKDAPPFDPSTAKLSSDNTAIDRRIDNLLKNAPTQQSSRSAETIANEAAQNAAVIADQSAQQANQQQINEQFLNQFTGVERAHYEKILAAHPDAMQIVQSQDFINWENSLKPELRESTINSLSNGTAEEVNIVLRWYKEDRGMVPKQN